MSFKAREFVFWLIVKVLPVAFWSIMLGSGYFLCRGLYRHQAKTETTPLAVLGCWIAMILIICFFLYELGVLLRNTSWRADRSQQKENPGLNTGTMCEEEEWT
jgi:hypothetical protein